MVDHNKTIVFSAATALAGYITSGPLAFLIVSTFKPQPAWVSAEVFAKNYSPLQDMPFFFGFLLVGGMLMYSIALYIKYYKEKQVPDFSLVLSVCCTIIFCTLVAFNYICQTTFVHNLALNYHPVHDNGIFMFSMSNPLSLCWAIEMWGYAFLGIATWLMAGYYRYRKPSIRVTMILNGIISLGSAIWTAIDVNWVMTTAGLAGYFFWNVLMIYMMISVISCSRKEIRAANLKTP